MKLTKSFYFLIPVLLLAIFSIAACSSLKPVELKKVESVKILKSSSDGIDLEVNMILKNPNHIGFTITGGELNIVLNKVDMGKATLSNRVRVPANSEISQKFIVHSSVSTALLGGFASLFSLFKNNNAQVSLTGNIRARSFLITKTFPVDEKTTIPFSLGGD